MKKTFFACLAALLLLAGCGSRAEDAAPTVTEPAATAPTVPQGCYLPESDVEQLTGSAVRMYRPDISAVEDLAVMGTDLLFFSSWENGTRLTVFTGDDLYLAASLDVKTHIDPDAPSTLVTPEGVSFYDPVRRETVLLDENLREILRVPAPEGMIGEPLLSQDRLSLFYLRDDSICALDLETSIPRTIRQLSAQNGTLQALILEDSILVYHSENVTQFLSVQTGQIIDEWDGWLNITSAANHYQATLTADGLSMLVFGSTEVSPKTLRPADLETPVFLPRSGAVVNITADTLLTLDYYDLNTGLRRSSITLQTDSFPAAAETSDGILWLLSGTDLYRWDTGALPTGDNAVYTSAYHTRSNPDLAGIAQCQALAEEISRRHGVEVRIWEDAIAVQPWDYHLTEEYLVPILAEQLQALDTRLANFPEGFLTRLQESFHGLSICLVRSLTGTGGDRTLDDASGLQFWVEDHAYIALSTLHATEGSLYHELCHVMDTRVFAHSNAYDQWEALNPNGFAYDYDYVANASRNAGEYLRDAERCFIDTYSMSFPKEDRARILEYAMTAGNEHYFQSKTMQNKLRQLCIGLREAFGLKKSPETFLWEQYLKESLAYTK